MAEAVVIVGDSVAEEGVGIGEAAVVEVSVITDLMMH